MKDESRTFPDAVARIVPLTTHPGDSKRRRAVRLFLVCAGCFFASIASRGQDTNYAIFLPATRLESFDTNIGKIIIKGTTEVGTVSANTGVLSVKFREITDTSSGEKGHGAAIEILRGAQSREVLLIDDDELAPLLNALDYFNRLDVSVTSLNSFDAAYTTKGGFRIAALGNRRTGQVQFGVRDLRTGSAPVVLSREQMTLLWGLIDQAKKQLDALSK